jgi:signal peptidase II
MAAPLIAALKQSVARSRPLSPQIDRVFVDADSVYAFPSGHAAFAGLLAASLWPVLPTRGRVVAVLFFVGVATSRVWLGLHFPTDVIIGGLIGAAVAAWVNWLLERWRTDKASTAGFALASAVVALDLATKTTIVATLRLSEQVEVTSFFNIVYWLNPGAAFSFLSDAGGWQRPFFIVLGLGVSAWLARQLFTSDGPKSVTLAFSLILGGALGNIFDRVFRGAVVDWLDFHVGSIHWPAFNAADIAISVGAAMLLILTVSDRSERRIA